MIIAVGMPLWVGFIVVVMGLPLLHYLKRDEKYNATKGQPESIRLNAWYV